jgi:hypothetical protein
MLTSLNLHEHDGNDLLNKFSDFLKRKMYETCQIVLLQPSAFLNVFSSQKLITLITVL